MAVKDGRLLEAQLGRGPFACFETPIEQGSKASQKAQKRTFCHTETAWRCGADRAFEGQLVVAPSAPELLLSEGRKVSRRCPVGRHQVAFCTIKEECQEKPPAREKAPFATL